MEVNIKTFIGFCWWAEAMLLTAFVNYLQNSFTTDLVFQTFGNHNCCSLASVCFQNHHAKTSNIIRKNKNKRNSNDFEGRK